VRTVTIHRNVSTTATPNPHSVADELGHRNLTLLTILRLVNALGLTPGKLLGGLESSDLDS
jgi:hypothetical protein